jgi:hypothetical protein
MMPLNVLNEKIFVFVWFWLVFLTAITGLNLVYRIAVITVPRIRVALITFVTGSGETGIAHSDFKIILDQPHLSWFAKVGDWFVLYLICKNIVDVSFVIDLVKKLKQTTRKKPAVLSSSGSSNRNRLNEILTLHDIVCMQPTDQNLF